MNELDTLLTDMLSKGGSDLHLAVDSPPKTRIDGVIHLLNQQPIGASEMEALLKEVTPAHRWESFTRTGDVDLAYEIPGKARFRMNLFKNSWGMASVLRQSAP